MAETYKVYINHYTDGLSGHFNVTFGATGSLVDLTVGINLNGNAFFGISQATGGLWPPFIKDGIVQNEDFKISEYSVPEKSPYFQRKAIEVTAEQYSALRSTYEALIGTEVNYHPFAHPFWGENCTFLPAEL